jgi:PKD repeat protein
MFSVFKGLELLQVTTIPNAPANPDTPAGDWWGDYSHYLVNTQVSSGLGLGYWDGYSYWGPYLATPWDIVILQATVFPVSVDVIVPGAACDETGYEVTVHYSVERFTANGTLYVYRDDVLYETVLLADFIGSETLYLSVAPESLGSHTWKAVLDVTGGGISTTAEDTDTSTVYTTPQVSGILDQIAPFTPFDLDDFQTCDCPDVDWQALGVPSGWTVTIDSNNVATVTAPEGASDPVEITFEAIFHWPSIDCSDSDVAIFSPNRPPVAHPGKIYPEEKYYVNEGSTVELDGTRSSDPDGDAITHSWDLDDDGVFESPGAIVTFSAAALDGPAEFYVFLKVVDEHGAFAIGQTEVEIVDVPPDAEFSWSPEPQDEGSAMQFTDQSTSIIDPIISWEWDFAGLGTSNDQNPSFIFEDNGVFSVSLTVTDDDGNSDTISHDVTISNVPPAVGLITGPMDPVQVGTPIIVFAEFTDPGTADTHTAVWDWGDGMTPGTVNETGGSGSVEDSYTYTEAGIHTLVLTVTDDDGGSGQSQFQYVVVYDPSAGFVTGGGWINSPAGAYKLDPSLFGKANFGFVAKYKKGANVPMGQTEFQFHVADLNFHSSSYDWLVVTGSNYARFKGAGTINDAGGYKFMLWAGDGSPDTFRIKIWQEDEEGNETVIYDNCFDQAIDKGSIVIHD